MFCFLSVFLVFFLFGFVCCFLSMHVDLVDSAEIEAIYENLLTLMILVSNNHALTRENLSSRIDAYARRVETRLDRLEQKIGRL